MSGFERKNLPNGQPNPKYIDLCDEDPIIAGQKFACISFISPEKIVKQRELFLFDQFIKQWDFVKSMGKFYDFIQFLSYKYNLSADDLMNDYMDFLKEEDVKLKSSDITDEYKNYLDKNENKLNERFQKENQFQTSVRGIKIRGVYNTQEEAELRCKKIREIDPNHDIYVGPVGTWIPWDPDAYKTGRIEFMEEELNQLHNEKIKNEARAKEEFERRIKETKRKAIEENIALAKKSGNVLTQTIDEDGNLIGVKERINFEERTAVDEDEIQKANEEFVESVVDKK
jgi:hypothetical protein